MGGDNGEAPDRGAGKQEQDVIRLAAARMKVTVGQCGAFEDSQAGATAAVRAGCRVHVLAPAGLTPADYPGTVIWLDSLNDVSL